MIIGYQPNTKVYLILLATAPHTILIIRPYYMPPWQVVVLLHLKNKLILYPGVVVNPPFT
jgi:hypothetical protein